MHTKRREQGEASRQAVLDAATNLIATLGYDGMSMSQLAKASGLPSSSIYWHFGSKEGVLAAVMERGATRFFDSVQITEEAKGTPLERLRFLIGSTAHGLIVEHTQFLEIQLTFRLHDARHESTAVAEVVESVLEGGITAMKRVLRHSFAEYGEEAAGRVADELAQLAVAMVDGVFLHSRRVSSDRVERLTGQMSDALFALGLQVVERDRA